MKKIFCKMQKKLAGKRKNNEPASSKKSMKFIKFCSESVNDTKEKTNESKCEPPPFDLNTIDCELIAKAQNPNIKKLSEEVKKIVELSERNAYDVILSAAMNSNIEDLIDLKFTNQVVPGSVPSEKYCCEFFVGTTKIAIGIGYNRYAAKIKASENALFILTHFKESPQKNLEGMSLKSTGTVHSQNTNTSHSNSSPVKCNDDVKDFLKKLAYEMKHHDSECASGVTKFNNQATRLKMQDDIVFKMSSDPTVPKHASLYLCDLFIKNTLIGQGEGSKMKKAKSQAAENGVKFLMKLIENDEITANDSKSKEILPNEREKKVPGCSKNSTEEVTAASSDINKKPIPLNKMLLSNSYRMQFLLFDKTEVLPSNIYPPAALSLSAQMCRKCYSYNYVTQANGTIRADVLLDEEVKGTGFGASKEMARAEAAKNAFESLQKQVYTVKVKAGVEEGFHVNRKDMLELKCDTSEAVSEDNIGCRMLKMMGWSGGGIGKKQGIAEPISAGNHSFGRGLGYADLSGRMDMKNLKSKIETLLHGYSNSFALIPLIFSVDFTKDERKEIHRIAQKFNLHNNSYGKGESRQLLIKRKISVTELLDSIVEAGGRTQKYELVDMSQ